MKTNNKMVFAVMAMALAFCTFAYAAGNSKFVGTWADDADVIKFNKDGTWKTSRTYNSGICISLKGKYAVSGGDATLKTITSIAVNEDVHEFEPIEYGAVYRITDGKLRIAFRKVSKKSGLNGTYEMIRYDVYSQNPSGGDGTKAVFGAFRIVKETLVFETDNGGRGYKRELLKTKACINPVYESVYANMPTVEKEESADTWDMYSDDIIELAFYGQKRYLGYTGKDINNDFGDWGFAKVE